GQQHQALDVPVPALRPAAPRAERAPARAARGRSVAAASRAQGVRAQRAARRAAAAARGGRAAQARSARAAQATPWIRIARMMSRIASAPSASRRGAQLTTVERWESPDATGGWRG